MINLEPIPSKIQRRLKQKQNVLGRKTREFDIGQAQTSGDLRELSFDMLATRTPFIRMTSGLEEPVVLMGGELKRTPEEETDLTLPGGYDEIYGARRLINEGASNELRRPVPGLKSVSAEFLGGTKATRRATISWSCWSFEDIDRLTPHFLQHGHSVLVEWGWVYSKKQLENLVNFRNLTGFEGGTIKPDVYANYRDTIVNEFGDIDVMAGVISNYEYTTREDGGFDCQTIITSLGVNLFNRVEKNKEVGDNSVVVDLSKVFNDKERKIEFNTNTSFKAFLAYIDRYIAGVFENEVLGKELSGKSFATGRDSNAPPTLYHRPNEYLVKYRQVDDSTRNSSRAKYFIDDVWVRWGWFEDNILSQFTTLTNRDGQIVARFRSVEENLDDEENSTAKYQSTQIRNHKYLETIDFNSYILPGQFYPLKSREVEGLETKIKGDRDLDIAIATIVNDKVNFKPFSTGIDNNKTTRAESFGQVKSDTNGGGSHGFLRNMLINTSMIKEAFGVQTKKRTRDGKNFKIEPMNINQGIQTLFKNINGVGGLSMWNFIIKQDETDDERLKIIDDSTTFIDFNSPEPLSSKKTKTFFKDDLNIDGEPGIFYFPVWQTDSIVKGQNITARIPSALQIATMYGANTGETLKEPNNVASNHEPVGVIAGAVGSNNVDKRFVGSDIAIRNRHAIGPKEGKDENELNVQNKTKILDFLLTDKTIRDELTKSNNTMAKERDAKALSNVQLALHESVREKFKEDVKKPVPTIEYLSEDDLNFILSDKALPELFALIDIGEITKELKETGVEEQAALNKADDELLRGMTLAFEKVRTNFLENLGGKYGRDGVMKENFLNAMKDKITYTLTTANDNMPILIPLELELEIDGIGGIYPGNSFHSTYLPERYQDKSVFQIVSVNHDVSESGWKVTLIGKMRTSIAKVLPTTKEEFSQEDVSINALKFKFLEDLINAAPESVKEANQKSADFDEDENALEYYGTPIGQAVVIYNKISRKISRFFD